MKTIFMGTPDFARVILEKICAEIGTPDIVVTQPDRPKGRGKNLTPPPVKVYSMERNIPVLQPQRLRDISDQLRDAAPEFIVVAAFGQILDRAILGIPSKACVNVHASLLPEYRGASPINAAVIDGLKITGVTTMLMEEGLDSGDILLKREIAISPEDTAETLHDRLAAAGANLCIETLLRFDSIAPLKQDSALATCARKLTKETGRIDWSRSATDINNLIRGCTPWPGTFTFFNDRQLKILKAEVPGEPAPAGAAPGMVIRADSAGILVSTGGGCLLVTELQAVGKNRLSADSFLRGFTLSPGDIFTKDV